MCDPHNSMASPEMALWDLEQVTGLSAMIGQENF